VLSLDTPLPSGLDKDDLDYFDDNMEMDMKVEMFIEECGKKDMGNWG
jgi:hypothetical protein